MIKAGPGGSRVDLAPDPKAPQTIGRTIESKSIDLSAYRTPAGDLDEAAIRSAVRQHITQVEKHETALREGRVPDQPFKESLVYTAQNANPGEAARLQDIVRSEATPRGVKTGVLELDRGILRTPTGRPVGSIRPSPGEGLLMFVDPEFVAELNTGLWPRADSRSAENGPDGPAP